jgi:hypothetical protein
MPRVAERRRHDRTELACPASLLDKSGRVLLRGRAADVSPVGVRLIGPRRLDIHPGQSCWVELTVPNPSNTGPRRRIVKLQGEVYRCSDMGEWKNVVVILRANFSKDLLRPVL